jgi:hypothetical protein
VKIIYFFAHLGFIPAVVYGAGVPFSRALVGLYLHDSLAWKYGQTYKLAASRRLDLRVSIAHEPFSELSIAMEPFSRIQLQFFNLASSYRRCVYFPVRSG